MDYCAKGTLGKPTSAAIKATAAASSTFNYCFYVKQVAAALQHVHDQNRVHRDVKPANLLIGDRDEILLSDFGISVRSYTRTPVEQIPVGTLFYMAPEQIEGKASSASDQYALGVVVYEWLSGTVPFTGNTEQILNQHMYVKPASLRGRGVGISLEIEEVVMRALEKEPRKRFKHILEFSNALERAAKIPSPIPPGPRQLTYRDHDTGVSAVAWSSQRGMIASGSGNGTVLVWDAMTLHQHYSCSEHVGSVRGISWSPDGKQFATADENGSIFIWNAQNGELIQQWQAHESVRSLAWHPHKPTLLSAGNDGTVRFWDTTTGALMSTYPTQATMVDAVAWSADGSFFACGCDDNSVRVLEEATHHYLSLYSQHADRVASISWLPVGARLYIASGGYDCTIQIWDVITQKLFSTYKDHSDAVLTVAWSPNGLYLASGSCDHMFVSGSCNGSMYTAVSA